MRILNRVIVASALVVPMALGASGVALAGVAAGSSVQPAQVAASEADGSVDCSDKSDGLLGGLLDLGGSNTMAEDECAVDGNSQPS